MKEAGALTVIGKAGKSVASLAEGTATRIPGSGGIERQLAAPRQLNKLRVGAAVSGAALAGAGIAAMSGKKKDQEKQAAVGLLINAGIDFDTAVNLVEKKAAQLA